MAFYIKYTLRLKTGKVENGHVTKRIHNAIFDYE